MFSVRHPHARSIVLRPLLFLGILLICGPAAAQADRDTATVLQNTPIYLLPDATRTPLRTAAAGTILEVLSTEGTWLQVRFQDPQFGVRVGYIDSKSVRRAAADLRPVDLSMPPLSRDPQPANLTATPQNQQEAFAGLVDGKPDSGTTEIMALGSVTGASADGEITTEVLLSVFTGVFANRYLEIGGTLTGYKLADFDFLGSAGGTAIVNFPNDSILLPFIGGGVGKGFGYSDLIGSPWYIDVEGGFRILTPKGGGSLVIRPFYQRQFFSGELGEGDLNLFGLAIGASVLF